MILGTSAIDVGGLVEVAWVSLVSGVLLVIAVSLSIVGAARAAAERRDGHATAATLYGAMSIAFAAVCGGGIVLGVVVMLSK